MALQNYSREKKNTQYNPLNVQIGPLCSYTHSQAVAPATFDLFLIDGDIIGTMCSIYGLFFYPLWAYRAACFSSYIPVNKVCVPIKKTR